MRLHGTQKIISTEFRATKSRAAASAFENARLKLVWAEIGTSRHRDNHP
jgi:hypothetical protein